MSGHQCPVRGCTRMIPFDKLMCPQHWRMVQPALASSVYRYWYREAGGQRHQAACKAAIADVEGKL